MMEEFLQHWYGILAFVLFDVLAFIAVVAITYRWLFKRVFDFLAALVCILFTSPLFLVVLIRGKRFKSQAEVELSLLERTPFVSKKGKTVLLTTFRYADQDGDVFGKYGNWLVRTGLYKLPYLFDVLCGRIAFIGVKPLSEVDAEFIDEENEARFLCRAGLINPLVRTGDSDTTYEEMLNSDNRYAIYGGFGTDISIFFTWLLKLIREGKKDEYFGHTRDTSYAQTLLSEGEITTEDFNAVLDAYKK